MGLIINPLKEYSEIYLILGFIVFGIYLVGCLLYLKNRELWKRNIKLRNLFFNYICVYL